MKGYTSRIRFDEHRRFTSVQEEMGRVRLDADANEQARIVRTDARRRSADLAEGSPDDGFCISQTHLIDPIRNIIGWGGDTLDPGDQRMIRPELGLARRDPETLPRVVRVRGYTRVIRRLASPLDIFHLPLPVFNAGDTQTYSASALILNVRFLRPPTDDEILTIQAVVLDANGDPHPIAIDPQISGDDLTEEWIQIRLPISAFAGFPRGQNPIGAQTLLIRGWGLDELPPRAEIYFDGLEAEDPGLGDDDFVIRGGDGSIEGSGRIYVNGWRSFIEKDWRYRRQPDLPDPPAIASPADPEQTHHLVYLEVWERSIHAFQDEFLEEPALDGDDTTFRTRKVSQIKAIEWDADRPPILPAPTGAGLLTTDIQNEEGLEDRYPPEIPDPCRDRCLFTENASTGVGYRGTDNIHVRVEVILGGVDPIVAWSRNNAATVAPLSKNAVIGVQSVRVAREDANRFQAGDMVVVEDVLTRLQPEQYPPVLRQLRAVDTAGGRLEFQPAGQTLPEPAALEVGGELSRLFSTANEAAVRRWDAVDQLLTGVRYNLHDGLTFAFSGEDFRIGEYWTFTARITHPDGEAFGTIDKLENEPVHGPGHERTPLARIRWTEEGREFEDLRLRFLPLRDVRDRLIELGRRKLSPGAFTVVVGDGIRTFGDFDQNLAENVTGDEVLQAALDRLGTGGGTIYIRAGRYELEHTVLVQGRNRVRIIGDGDATHMVVRAAGGAFYLDRCGLAGQVCLEHLRITEEGEALAPGGLPGIVPGLGSALDGILSETGVREALILQPTDLIRTVGGISDFVDQLAASVAQLRPGLGSTAASVVKTLIELRRLQRLHPGQPLDEVAPDLLEVLRRLPHGVVTVSDSRNICLKNLNMVVVGAFREEGIDAPAVLLTGHCTDIAIKDSEMRAPAGILAAGYGRYLTPTALVLRPRSGLFLSSIRISGNRIEHIGETTGQGIRLNDGMMQGIWISDNRVSGFSHGVFVEDRSESRAEAVDRTVIRENEILGADEIGLQVICSGVDIDANEVRSANGSALLRAGVRVNGRGIRVRGNWVILPGTSANPPVFGVEAGIVVGTGYDDGGVVAASSGDIEISDNRVEGTGGDLLGTGVLIGGPHPVFDVRIHGNTIRNLGGAGIRAWAYATEIGALRITDNRIEDVSLRFPEWGARAIEELRDLAPAAAQGLADTADPEAVLQALLDEPESAIRPALDAMLRWLEASTLRGGVLLTLVEGSEIRNNQIKAVGNTQMPPGLDDLDIRTAGIAVIGGWNVTVRGNVVEAVTGAVQILEPPGPRPVPRPPIFDFLAPLAVGGELRAPGFRDTHGAIVALRRDIMGYAQGTGRQRQQLGHRIYGALESVESALEERGTEGARLARELSDGLAGMREAQSYNDHTTAANQVRAALSDAASLTAPDETEGIAWTLAARLDHALLVDEGSISEIAGEVMESVEELTKNLDEVDFDLAESAAAVIKAPGQKTTQLSLARDLGTMAEARGNEATLRDAMPEDGLTDQDRTVLTGMVKLLDERLNVEDPTDISDEDLASLEKVVTALVDRLRELHEKYAQRLESSFAVFKKTGGKATEADVAKLREVLADIQKLSVDPDSGTKVRSADLESQNERQKAQMIILSAEQLDRRLGGLTLEIQSSATRELRVLGKTVGQMTNLVHHEPTLRMMAKEVEKNIDLALEDPDNRWKHQAAAREKLLELKKEQSRLAGVKIGVARPPADPTESDTTQQLAGMGQLLIQLRKKMGSDLRIKGADLFEKHAQRTSEQLELKPSVREALLSALPDALAVITGDADGATRAKAIHVLSDVLERLSRFGAKASDAGQAENAVWVLNGALMRALDDDVAEADRATAAKRWIGHNKAVLSGSVTGRFESATTAETVLGAVDTGLAGITKVKPVPVIDVDIQIRTLASPQPADGLLAAGVQGRLNWRDNSVEQVRIGAAVIKSDEHILAPSAENPQLAVTFGQNRFLGAAVSGITLRPDATAIASVIGNDVTGCGGLHSLQSSPYGRAIIEIDGGGELQFSDNLLQDNGGNHPDTTLHEALIHWSGDMRVSGNRIRHGGGGAGGSGVVVMTGEIAPDLVKRLSREAALVVEAPPELPKPKPGKPSEPRGIDDLIVAGLAEKASVLESAGSFSLGAIKMRTLDERPIYDRFQFAARSANTGELAMAKADSWLSIQDRVKDPIFDFLKLPPPIIILPFPILKQRKLHFVDNDILADGPALLVLSDTATLLSATMVGNDLESTATTGAVYLRNVDATVVSGNRFECPREVNVVVVRAGQSQVGVTGNTITGAEPTTPTIPPLPGPKPLPTPVEPVIPGGLTLGVDLGIGKELKIPLNPEAIRKAIDNSRDIIYGKAADEAETAFKNYTVETKWKAIKIPDTATKDLLLQPKDGGIQLKSGIEKPVTEKKSIEAAPKKSAESLEKTVEALSEQDKAAIDNINLFLKDPVLTPQSKLYGVYIASGRSETEAKTAVRNHMTLANGNGDVALQSGVNAILGVEYTGEMGRAAVEARPLLEEILDIAIGRPDILIPTHPIDPVKPIPPPPDPRGHSVVIIGGSRVGAVNNVTTAGVHIHNAVQSIENNL